MRVFEVVNIVIHKEIHINQGEFLTAYVLAKKVFNLQLDHHKNRF